MKKSVLQNRQKLQKPFKRRAKTEKTCRPQPTGFLLYGGPDGTRTRDLRRDRPAF